MAIANSSIASTKTRGKRGQPWRVPLPRLKGLDIMLLVVTEAIAVFYNILTQVIK